MTRTAFQRGFTVLEVMIALAILAGSLVLLIGAAAGNVERAHQAQALGVATNLARGRMYDIEEQLLDEGFQQLEQTLDGDFSDEGYDDIQWEATIQKVELPGLAAMQAATGQAEGEAAEAAGGLGLGGGGGGDPMAAMGAGMIASQFELLSSILEESIRKVTLTVTWSVGREEHSMVVVCYFTDARGVDVAIAGGSGADEEGEQDADQPPSPEPPSRGVGSRINVGGR